MLLDSPCGLALPRHLLPHALALLAFSAVLLPLGLAAFALAIRYAKKNGTLGQY